MISPETLALAALAQLPDTVVAVQAGATGLEYWVELLSGIATIVIALALIALGLLVLGLAWQLRRLSRRVAPVLERFRGDVDPIVKHATSVADNVDYVSTAVRGDVERLQRTVDSATQRVNRMAAAAEKRVHELDALLRVIQEEAEDLFIGTASTVRGVREGTEELRRLREEEHDDEPGGPDEGLQIRVRRV